MTSNPAALPRPSNRLRSRRHALALGLLLLGTGLAALATPAVAQERTQKPPLHGKSWMAITGKPLAATAGAMMFQRGGNAVDASCAMIAATATMWDTLSWGGETQALIWHPREQRVIAINALGVAPTGATVEFFRVSDCSAAFQRATRSVAQSGTSVGRTMAEDSTPPLRR